MPATGIEPVLCHHNRILSPARLPVPPRRQLYVLQLMFGNFHSRATYYISLLYNTQWAEVDSNHRSNLQQIYSLSPLATRESTHFVKTYVLTDIYYSTVYFNMQAFFIICCNYFLQYVFTTFAIPNS